MVTEGEKHSLGSFGLKGVLRKKKKDGPIVVRRKE